MLGGRSLETENKRIFQTSDLKSGRGRLRNLSSDHLRSLAFFTFTGTYEPTIDLLPTSVAS